MMMTRSKDVIKTRATGRGGWLTAGMAVFFLLLPLVAARAEVVFRTPFGIAVRPEGSFAVGEIDGARVALFDSAGELIGTITEVEGYGPLRGVFDVDYGPSGYLYICDGRGDAVLVLDPQHRLVLKLGMGERTAAPGGFHQPHFVHPDEQRGRIYVADTHNNRVQVFDMAGKLLKVRGEVGRSEAGQFKFSAGVTVDDEGNLYAMNWSGGYVTRYDAQWQPSVRLGGSGKGPGEFNSAYGITFHNGAFWVADTFSSRIQQFSRDWQVLSIIDNGQGSDVHQFNHPTDLDFDGEGNMYVADWRNDRVVKLSPRGTFMRQWGSAGAVMAYEPPQVYGQDPCRGPRTLAVYAGISKAQVDTAAEAGVDHIYVSFANQDRDWPVTEQVAYAATRGIKVSASIAVYPLGAELPQWKQRPEMYMWKKGGDGPDMMALSYAIPEVRTWKARHIAEQMHRTGMYGVLLDYIRYPNTLGGYEPVMLKAFKAETGLDAAQLPPDDWQWMKFRAKQITLFISELRYELAQLDREVEISIYVSPSWEQRLRTVLADWREWVRMGLVDRVMLGLYTRDFESLYEGVRQARATCLPHTKINLMIACWGGNLSTPELLRKGAAVGFAAGADEIGIYRGDAIEQLKLWPAIQEIAAEHKGQ